MLVVYFSLREKANVVGEATLGRCDSGGFEGCVGSVGMLMFFSMMEWYIAWDPKWINIQNN